LLGINSVAYVPGADEFYLESRFTNIGLLKLLISKGLKSASKKHFKDYVITEIGLAD